MLRRCLLLVLLMAGCGGRDPLYGEIDPGPTPLPGTGGAGAGGGGSTPRDAGRDTIVIMVPPTPTPLRDAGTTTPPMVNRDGGATPRPDAAVAPPPINACVLPRCIAALMTPACTPAGACTQQRASGGNNAVTNTCYANGVKYLPAVTGMGRNPSVVIRVTGASGAPCYSVESTTRGGGVNALDYRGPGGQLVATATVERGGLLAVTCVGEMTPQIIAANCQPGVPGGTVCSPGTCM